MQLYMRAHFRAPTLHAGLKCIAPSSMCLLLGQIIMSIGLLQGFVLVGPALHWWYGTIGRVISASGNTGTTKAPL